ncbi:maleylpyruvate isomerase N-terminal domain-containing protein [Pseudonocardia sp. DSM 110487]|uniref:maleylpyruvate isomerase N-terminal domain-containing protein n=1 Tax=Pseudonocardia sp. DSM 110487 TaxID=2865833 RepID=UPI001C6A5436|nr:maleylpyruvate isomerase N-terminal domain-containing protein [Pseudonocardia sp. DSM 110487]QYN31982.1 maleylpyruvate isomerase N-terminal domain-containing protein [Pseudonocardia sp. DSM 110487]
MQVDHDAGRTGFLDAMKALRAVADGLDDDQLLVGSRCRGWTVGDVLVHVHLGLQEMLLGVVSPTDRAPDIDAASYWSTPAGPHSAASPVGHVRFVRAMGAAYRSPTGIVAHLRPTADALAAAVDALPDGVVAIQGHTMRTGDFLATWALELAVHHLDLGADLILPAPVPTALGLARATLEELAGGPLPWDDQTTVLIATGRLVPDEEQAAQAGPIAARLPVLG